MSQNESYTTDDIARLLKVSKLTVYDLIKKGELTAYRVGRQMRVDADDLERYKTHGKEKKMVRTTDSVKEAQTVVISGQDNSLDILARALDNRLEGYQPLRSNAGSLDSLIAMYQGKADIVSTHLLDGDTNEYNVPYIRKLLVSKSFIVIKFITRQAGLYVAKGNPKNIANWQDLKDPSIKIVNREAGAGSRVLLDEQLRINNINREEVNGYNHEVTSHYAVASAVANGKADVGVGIEQTSKVANVTFIPLITENYDLVMLKSKQNEKLIKVVMETMKDNAFKESLLALEYDISNMGKIMWEQ